MYNVSPIPDFNDNSKVQQYIQDRRVIGVSPLPIHPIATHSLSSVRSPCPTCSSATWDHFISQRSKNNRLSSLQCSTHSSWSWRPRPCRRRSLLHPLPRTSFGICKSTQGKVGWLAQSPHHHASLFVSHPSPFRHFNPADPVSLYSEVDTHPPHRTFSDHS